MFLPAQSAVIDACLRDRMEARLDLGQEYCGFGYLRGYPTETGDAVGPIQESATLIQVR